MENPQKPRLEPRLVFAVLLVAIPLLYVVAHVTLVRSGTDCPPAERSDVGGFSQMFLPGEGCRPPPTGR